MACRTALLSPGRRGSRAGSASPARERSDPGVGAGGLPLSGAEPLILTPSPRRPRTLEPRLPRQIGGCGSTARFVGNGPFEGADLICREVTPSKVRGPPSGPETSPESPGECVSHPRSVADPMPPLNTRRGKPKELPSSEFYSWPPTREALTLVLTHLHTHSRVCDAARSLSPLGLPPHDTVQGCWSPAQRRQ